MHPELVQVARTLHQSAFPRKFAVEVCADCNFACTMCHHPNMLRPKGVMPLELWKRCADEIARISPRTECWFSFCGEPLMEPDRTLAMLDYGRSVGLQSLNVNTNGQLLTTDIADRLLDSGVHLIVIGIDGFSKEVYEQVRKGGERDTVYSNVEYLIERRLARGSGPEIQVQFIEMLENSHELRAFNDYWLAKGASLKVRKMLSWGGKFDAQLDVSAEERIPCPWAVTMMHVFWDGRVPRCPGDTEGDESVGNAWDEPLEVLWGKLDAYRALHLERHFDRLPERCQTCTDWAVGVARRIHSNENVA